MPEASTSSLDPEAAPGGGAADTRDRLLDSAERLFAEHGAHRASLRAITQQAKANVAAVNYHFGSKEGLLREVLSRRLRPLNRERLEALDRATAAARRGAPRTEDVVRAFVAPVLSMVQREEGGHRFARLVTRLFSEPDPAMRRLVLTEFDEVIPRFTSALAEALPDLPRKEIFWRFSFMVGAMTHTAGLGFLVQELSGGLCDPLDVEGVTHRLVGFVSAGLEAGETPEDEAGSDR